MHARRVQLEARRERANFATEAVLQRAWADVERLGCSLCCARITDWYPCIDGERVTPGPTSDILDGHFLCHECRVVTMQSYPPNDWPWQTPCIDTMPKEQKTLIAIRRNVDKGRM